MIGTAITRNPDGIKTLLDSTIKSSKGLKCCADSKANTRSTELLIKGNSSLKEKIDSLQKIVESSEVNDLELQKLQNQVESLIVSLEEEKQKFIDQKNKNDHIEKQKLEISTDNKNLNKRQTKRSRKKNQ